MVFKFGVAVLKLTYKTTASNIVTNTAHAWAQRCHTKFKTSVKKEKKPDPRGKKLLEDKPNLLKI